MFYHASPCVVAGVATVRSRINLVGEGCRWVIDIHQVPITRHVNVLGQHIGHIAADILNLCEVGLNIIAAFGGQVDLTDAGDDQQAQGQGYQ